MIASGFFSLVTLFAKKCATEFNAQKAGLHCLFASLQMRDFFLFFHIILCAVFALISLKKFFFNIIPFC